MYVDLKDQVAGASSLKRANGIMFVQCAAFVCKIRPIPQTSHPPPPHLMNQNPQYTSLHGGLGVYCRLGRLVLGIT
jgi:hypothetical protein